MMTLPQSRPRRLEAAAAVLLAAGVLAGSAAPSAATTWPPNQGFTSEAPHTPTSFHRHFWRGSQVSRPQVPSADLLAVADDAEAMDAYCMNRFKSYDPATGTYLGYDGNEHPCP